MEFKPNKPFRRISGKGVLVLIQNGHIFAGENVYVGPEPKGSGSMTPWELLAGMKAVPKPPKKKIVKKVEKKKPTGLFLGIKPKRKAYKRIVGRK